jgi:hypothetical protein
MRSGEAVVPVGAVEVGEEGCWATPQDARVRLRKDSRMNCLLRITEISSYDFSIENPENESPGKFSGTVKIN